MDNAEIKLRSLTELSEITCTNTNEEGCSVIREQVAEIRKRLKELKSNLAEKKEASDKSQRLAADSQRNCELALKWIKDTELRLKSESAAKKKDVNEKKIKADKLKVCYLNL